MGTELFGELWWPSLLGRKPHQAPLWLLQEDSQAVPLSWKCAGSLKNELLSGQQVFKLLLLVLLAAKGDTGLGKEVTAELWERIWTWGNGVMSLFHWSGNLIYSLYLFA